ncbi:unnamed protein product [Paramecium pentaurelia]|uniref:EamA domain-containing protein n=1 Tax=Paramecium pentaurelia TaxID=43138 RepID=A0A8S1T4U0_9CILI|nr:unnamed protein product [Paramecium pentaurelia]
MTNNEQKSVFFINSLLVGMILVGTFNTLVYKYQNTTVIDGVTFIHPYMQALCMFVGEATCLVFYFVFQMKAEKDPNKEDGGFKILSIPALFDGITSSLQHVALNFIPSSIYQMLRGGLMIVTAAFSKFVLKKKLSNQQQFGILLAILGIFIVGLSNFLFRKATSDDFSWEIKLISIALIIVSLFTQAAQYIFEEKLFQQYNYHVFYVVGVEGMWGLLYFGIVMPILNFIPCNFKEGCVFRNEKGYWECTDVFFQQLGADVWLTVSVVMGIFSIALFNIFGVNVTKYVSALTRTVVDTIRTILIWGIGLIVTATTSRVWENTSKWANLIELVGFVFLVLGNLIYKEMLKIRFLQNKKQVLIEEE